MRLFPHHSMQQSFYSYFLKCCSNYVLVLLSSPYLITPSLHTEPLALFNLSLQFPLLIPLSLLFPQLPSQGCQEPSCLEGRSCTPIPEGVHLPSPKCHHRVVKGLLPRGECSKFPFFPLPLASFWIFRPWFLLLDACHLSVCLSIYTHNLPWRGLYSWKAEHKFNK